MKEYKRLTERAGNGKAVTKGCKTCPDYCFDCSYADGCIDRLAELEDKIENGTLIELPRIIHPNKAEWYVQYQYPSGVIQYDICFSQAEAEAKLKELQEKGNEEII